jgi:hypothetical protein
MGACFDYYRVNVNTTKQLESEYRYMKRSVTSAFNYDGYSGTLAEDSGLEISIDDAIKFIDENTEKWGKSLAVQVKIRKNTKKGIPSQKYWVIGGWYSC